MVPGPFAVTIDHAQRRLTRHGIGFSVAGYGWDGPLLDHTWIDPVTHSLMLRPMCFYPDEWASSNSDIWTKPAAAAYEFKTGSAWAKVDPWTGGVYQTTSTAGEWARTVTAPGKNRGVLLSFFAYSPGDGSLLATGGWHNTDVTVAGSTLAFEVYAGGLVKVYKGGVYVDEGRLSFGASGTAQTAYMDIVFLPMRRNQMLVMSLTGSGFVVTFDDIDEAATSPEITPASKFWFAPNPSGNSAQVLIAPLRFKASGYATSVPIQFPRPPATGATLYTWANPYFGGITTGNLYAHPAFAGTTNVTALVVKQVDGTTNFVPNGSLSAGVLRIDLSGDGSYTPFVYAAYLLYQGATDLTNSTEVHDATPNVAGLSLDVPDAAFDDRASIEIINPDGLAVDVAKLLIVNNRPVKVDCDGYALVDGRSTPARKRYGLQDEVETATMDVGGFLGALDAYQFRDELPLDGFRLSRPVASGDSAVRFIASLAGIEDAQMLLSNDPFILPEQPGRVNEEWSTTIPVGSTAREAIERLHDTFAKDWFMGTRPSATGLQFAFLKEADLPTTAAITLYATTAAALAAGLTKGHVYVSLESEPEDVDANEVWVSGYDRRRQAGVQAYAEDAASQAVTTAPSSRPDNWLGEVRLFGVLDERIGSQAAADQTVAQLTPVVMSKRIQGQFETPAMLWYETAPSSGVFLPVWRGDLVTLNGYGTVRITSLSVDVVLNEAGRLVSRARYTFGGFTHNGGVTLSMIQARNRSRGLRGRTDVRVLSQSLGGALWSETRR